MRISSIYLKDSKETRTMYTKSRNIQIMMGNEINDIIGELRESLLQKYKKDLKETMTGLFVIVMIYCIIAFKK